MNKKGRAFDYEPIA